MTTEADALKFTAEQAVTANGKRIIETKNRQFLINGNGDIREFRPNDGANEALQVHTLTAVVDYIGKVSERSASPLIVQVVDENSVFVLGELDDFGNQGQGNASLLPIRSMAGFGIIHHRIAGTIHDH